MSVAAAAHHNVNTAITIDTNTKIFVAGHKGMVGSAILRALQGSGAKDIVTASHAELDLTCQSAVQQFFAKEKPGQVYLAAAKVGGIYANNTYPADFIYSNLAIQTNVIHAAFESGCKRLLFLGSSCIYPREAPQPMGERALLTGPLEPTNEPYAIAKIAGIKMCESFNRQYGESHGIDYRSIMPTNLYGPGDNYHPQDSHVVPALIARFHEAKLKGLPSVAIWGTGSPRREFLHVDDLAQAALFVMHLSRQTYANATEPMCSHINVGFGSDITIKELAYAIADTVGYAGSITFDASKPDGSPRKLMDSSLIKGLGFAPAISLTEGLAGTYRAYQATLHTT